MHRNVHDVTRVKSQPANGTRKFAINIWICEREVSGRFSGWFWLGWRKGNFSLRDEKLRAAIRAINRHSGGGFIRLQFATARWTKKANLHIPKNFENYAPEVQAISTNDWDYEHRLTADEDIRLAQTAAAEAHDFGGLVLPGGPDYLLKQRTFCDRAGSMKTFWNYPVHKQWQGQRAALSAPPAVAHRKGHGFHQCCTVLPGPGRRSATSLPDFPNLFVKCIIPKF